MFEVIVGKSSPSGGESLEVLRICQETADAMDQAPCLASTQDKSFE
jgi:hypothetical protein